MPRYDILTVHPEMCRGPIEHSMLARARAAGVIAIEVHDIRAHGIGKHRQVDDTPYGGGAAWCSRSTSSIARSLWFVVRRATSCS